MTEWGPDPLIVHLSIEECDMVRSIRSFLLGAVLALGCMSPDSTQAAAVWHTSLIRSVYPLGDGGVVVIFEVQAPTCSQNNTAQYHYLQAGANGVTQEGVERIYAVLLAAASQKKAVSINFDDASAQCYINRAIVNF